MLTSPKGHIVFVKVMSFTVHDTDEEAFWDINGGTKQEKKLFKLIFGTIIPNFSLLIVTVAAELISYHHRLSTVYMHCLQTLYFLHRELILS